MMGGKPASDEWILSPFAHHLHQILHVIQQALEGFVTISGELQLVAMSLMEHSGKLAKGGPLRLLQQDYEYFFLQNGIMMYVSTLA